MYKILFIIETPSPYRIAFMRKLGKLCELTVCFTRDKKHYGRPESWYDYDFTGFKAITPGKRIGNIAFEFSKYINKTYDLIILCDYASPNGIYIHHLLKSRHIEYAIESDGGFPKNGSSIKEKFKKHLMSSASWWFATAKMTVEYFAQYGADRDKVYLYPFTSLHDGDILPAVPSADEKLRLKEKLDLDNKKTVLSVGRFIPIKGFDILMKAAASLKDYSFIIVGGKPTEEYLTMRNKLGADNVEFVDFMSKKELNEYYIASDLFVLQTRGDVWGLVINEAMACALPVITTDRCIAGLELVRDDENGYIIPTDDDKTLAEKIKLILSDNALAGSMSEKSLEIIRGYTFEKMARRHIEIFDEIEKDKKKNQW